MKLPTVRGCCCGCSLSTGTIIIGVLASLVVLNNIVHLSIGTTGTESMTAYIQNALLEGFGTEESANQTMAPLQIVNETIVNQTSGNLIIGNTRKVNETVAKVDAYMRYVEYILNILALCVCIAMVYGALKKNASFVLPWLIMSAILYVSTGVMMIVFAIASFFLAIWVGVVCIIITIVSLALDGYFLTVVYSFYLELKEPPKTYDPVQQVNYTA